MRYSLRQLPSASAFGINFLRVGNREVRVREAFFRRSLIPLVVCLPTRLTGWGAILLTVLRMIQGIGVGGEWGGSVLLAMEWSRTQNQRGLIASWPQFGVPCGLLLWRLRQPTLVLMGRDDPLVPLINGRIVARLIPNAQLEIIDDGHLFMVTQPQEMAKRIEKFLSDAQ